LENDQVSRVSTIMQAPMKPAASSFRKVAHGTQLARVTFCLSQEEGQPVLQVC